MADTVGVPKDLADAAVVFSVQRDILAKLGRVAASPLHHAGAHEMQALLDRITDPRVRDALAQLVTTTSDRPALKLITGGSTDV